jgi:hypothetical protein
LAELVGEVREGLLALAVGAGLHRAGFGHADDRRVHFGEHYCVVALGIGIDGTKHPLSLDGLHLERHLSHRK